MGFWQDLTGQTAADASKAAASDTYGKQQKAIGDLTNYGDTYAQKFGDMSKSYAPYAQTGLDANSALQRLISDPSTVSSLPGYQFAQDQGIQALDRGAAAHGMLNSGRSSKDLLRFGTGLADQTYGSQLSRLMGLTQQGIGVTGAQNSTTAQGLQGQLGTRQTAYGGQMASAGTIGQGDIAAANARASGSQNLLNTGLKVAGMVAAPFTGGASLGLTGGGMGFGSSNPYYGAFGHGLY